MSTVPPIPAEHRNTVAPSELRRLQGWLIWRYEMQIGTGKQIKVPYWVDGGRRYGTQGSPLDRSKLTSFADARDAAARRGFDGVGFAMLADWGITALDFDKCVNEDGHLPTEVGQIVCRTYAEFSPSGKGIRAFVKGNLGNHKSIATPSQYGFETFNSTGFVTFTGRVLPAVELLDMQDTISDVNDDVIALCEKRFGASTPAALQDSDNPFAGHEPRLGLTIERIEELLSKLDPDMGRDGWIRVGMSVHHECQGDDTGFEIWNEWSAQGGKYPSEEGLRTQWDSFTRRMGPGRRQVTMASVIKMAKEAGRRVRESGNGPDAVAGNTPDYSILEHVDHTDAGNVALLFDLSHGDIRYVYERKQFIVWNGTRWETDKGNALTHQRMLEVADFYKKKADELSRQSQEAPGTDQEKHLRKAAEAMAKWSNQCRNKTRLDAMLGIMQRDPRFLIEASQLDSNPWLVGVANGVVDLKTGLLHPDSKQEYVLKRCPVDFNPTACAPRWNKFIEEITSRPGPLSQGKVTFIPRPNLAKYTQKALGYCLTGITDEHLMFGAVGRGANGKNVQLDTFKDVTGGYTETISPEVIMASRHEGNADQASPSIRKLAGARCAISSESKDGQRLDIAVVKRHTGGGSLTARGLHENPITFTITHKLWLMTNHIPRLDHMDEAIRARLHLIPFDMKWNRPGETNPDPTLPDADKGLMDALKLEQEGILLWLVRGAVQYHIEGLTPPREVVAFTGDYIASQDLLTRFLKDCEPCPVEEGATAGQLHMGYEGFCRDEGECRQIESSGSLGKRLRALGYASKKYRDGARYALRNKKLPENSTGESLSKGTLADLADEPEPLRASVTV